MRLVFLNDKQTIFFKRFFWPGHVLPATYPAVSLQPSTPTCALPVRGCRAEGLWAPLSSQRGSQGEAFSSLLFERNTNRHHGSRILPRQSAWGRGRLCVGGEGLARKDVMWWGIPGYRCRIPRCHSHALQMLSVWERALRNEPCRPFFPGRPRLCCQSQLAPGLPALPSHCGISWQSHPVRAWGQLTKQRASVDSRPALVMVTSPRPGYHSPLVILGCVSQSLRHLWKETSLGPIARVSNLEGLGHTPKICIYENSQMILLVQRSMLRTVS